MRLVESAHKLAAKTGTSAIKNIALAVSRVVDADLTKHKCELRNDFNLTKFMKEAGLSSHIESHRIDTSELADFSMQLAKSAQQQQASTTGSFEEFCTQLLHVLRKKGEMDSIFE